MAQSVFSLNWAIWPSRLGRDHIHIRIFGHVLVENATQHCLFLFKTAEIGTDDREKRLQ